MVDLTLFADAVSERRPEWERAGLTVQLHEGPDTRKPVSWVVLESASTEGELLIWVSGECEVAVGNKATGTYEATHLDLEDDGIRAALDDLSKRVLGGA
jgi:hypothetical protein